MKKEYIGDGVYAEYDGKHVWIKSNDIWGNAHDIALSPLVMQTLIEFWEALKNPEGEKGDK